LPTIVNDYSIGNKPIKAAFESFTVRITHVVITPVYREALAGC
jgi:hypothetical protein